MVSAGVIGWRQFLLKNGHVFWTGIVLYCPLLDRAGTDAQKTARTRLLQQIFGNLKLNFSYGINLSNVCVEK